MPMDLPKDRQHFTKGFQDSDANRGTGFLLLGQGQLVGGKLTLSQLKSRHRQKTNPVL